MATRILAPLLLGLATCSALGCGSPALAQCRVEAVGFLPEDPKQLTPYDVVDLVERLNACRVKVDAGG